MDVFPAVTNRLEAAADEGGDVSPAWGWCGSEASLVFEAFPDAGCGFLKWTGDVPPERAFDNPLHLPGDRPRSVRAAFMHIQHVAEYGDDANDGFSFDPAHAKRNIAAGIRAALLPGSLVLVTNGTYWVAHENQSPFTSVTLDREVTVRGVSGKPADVKVVLTSGDIWNHLLNITHPGARVENIQFQNAKRLTQPNNYIGAGIVSNCVITAGGSSWSGSNDAGGIWMAGGLVTHCVISHNTINLVNNTACGVRMTGGRLEHSLVWGNSVAGAFTHAGFAAGIYATGGHVVNCTVVRNSCHTFGGVLATGGARVINTVIAGNGTAPNNANPDQAAWGGDGACFIHCFTDTAAPINNACFNFPGDILLTDITGNDFTPAPGSPVTGPCADPALYIPGWAMPAADLAGNPRDWGGAMGAGCYNADPEKLAAVFIPDNKSGIATLENPAQVNFTVLVSGTNGVSDLEYAWDFGDGSGAVLTNTPNVFHEYGLGKFYTVTLTVTNLTQGGAAAVKDNGMDPLHFAAPVLRVDAACAAPGAPYDGWGNAARDLHAAIHQAVDGCEIIIRKGNYLNTASAGFNVEKALRILGENGDKPEEAVLYYNANYGGRVLRVNNAGAWVSGVTLQGGINSDGAGVRIDVYGGTVSNCVIRNNQSDWTTTGAAAFLNATNALLTHCRITGNFTDNNGGGIYDHAMVCVAAGRVENCLVAASYNRGDPGTYYRSCVIELRNNAVARNCTIVANTNLNRAVFWLNSANCLAEHNVVAGNPNLVDGGPSQLYFGNHRFLGNTADDAYGPWLAGVGNETCRLGAPEKIFKDFGKGDYRLGYGSPAINAGPKVDPALYPAFDLGGRPRVLGGKIDHGCYEANPPGTLFLLK